MRFILAICVVVAALGLPGPSAADTPGVVVLVHPDSRVTTLDRKFVADAFLKKRTRWSDDSAIHPVDQAPRSSVRARFSRAVVGRSTEAIRRYWSQLVFSGRGLPPPELRNDAAVVAYVASHRGAIGHVPADANVQGPRVVELR